MSGSDRAVSDVVGFVVVFGLVAVTVAFVSVGGMDSLHTARDAEQHSNAQRAFDVLSNNMVDVYRGGAPSRATEFSLADARMHTMTTATINVSGYNATNRTFTFETTVNPIVWQPERAGQTRLVYAFGAALRAEREGGLVVEDPPFVLHGDRLVLPIVKTIADPAQSVGGSTIRVRAASTSSGVVRATTAPDSDWVWVNVTSPRAGAWQRYFEQRSMTDSCRLSTTNGRQTVACKLSGYEELYVSVFGVDVELER
ncbi:MAG: hypothetical protein ABEJ31_00470 [Haloarculaceae archaeon]